MATETIKVAVRVRPFNQRELKANSECIISMQGETTIITDPEKKEKKTFAFDHSYWSHSGCKEDESGVFLPENSHSVYADQRRVYEDLGKGVLENAWQGYNAALFAYGQTGSGKSYSMIGYGANIGIVPITCGELFKGIEQNSDSSKKFQVTFSMLEIYNEQVRDLLASVNKLEQKGGLKIRQHPKTGFYVEGLKQVPVSSYEEIETLMDKGTVNRTTASTNMNATSSRSHMVITITFKQIYKNEVGQSTTKSSEISLVDLAGSERADSTGATGDRLKQGSAINQSLSTLGNVISALADVSAGKKKVMVPYRDSVLTKLLQGALGGNSKTVMIAALSPAAINYDETLSTLRYADRAKKIKNKAVVNEGLTDKLIRELREENKKLMEMLKQMQSGKRGKDDQQEIENLLRANTDQMNIMEASWEQRLEEARREWEKSLSTGSQGTHQEIKQAYLQNVNEDPQLSGVVKHTLRLGTNKIGRPNVDGVTIELQGLGIKEVHAVLQCEQKNVYITPHDVKSQVYVNGMRIKQRVSLMHMDRVKLGSNCLYLYVGPVHDRSSKDDYSEYNYDFFQSELVEAEGLTSDFIVPPSPRRGADSTDLGDMQMMLIFQEYTDLLPKVNDVNSMSKDMGKEVEFEVEVKNLSLYDTMGRQKDREVIVRVTDLRTKTVWIWSKGKFMNRKYLIEDLYHMWEQGASIDIEQNQDPFWDPVEDVFLGSCHMWLNNLAYCLDADDHLEIHNYRGRQEALVHMRLIPCDSKGRAIENLQNSMVFDPKELKGRKLNFLLSVTDCQEVKWIRDFQSRGVYFTFTFYDHEKTYQSKLIWNTVNPRFQFQELFSVSNVTDDFLEYLLTHALVLELWGVQPGREDSGFYSSSEFNISFTKNFALLEEQLKRQTTELNLLKKENSDLKSRPTSSVHKHVDKLNCKGSSIQNGNSLGLTHHLNGSASSSMKNLPFESSLNGARLNPRENTACKSAGKRQSSEKVKVKQTANFEAEIGKALKVFFKDMKEVQRQLSQCRDLGSPLPEDLEKLKDTVLKQQKSVTEVEGNVNDTLTSLRETMLQLIKKRKQEEGCS